MRRPITFMRRCRISDSRSASWRIRGPVFKISMVQGCSPRRALKTGSTTFQAKAGTKSTTFQRKRGALRCCSMPFHICLAVGTSHQVLPSETEARNNGLSQLLGLHDGRTCQRFALIDIRSTSIRACASITQRESSRGVKMLRATRALPDSRGSFHCYPK